MHINTHNIHRCVFVCTQQNHKNPKFCDVPMKNERKSSVYECLKQFLLTFRTSKFRRYPTNILLRIFPNKSNYYDYKFLLSVTVSHSKLFGCPYIREPYIGFYNHSRIFYLLFVKYLFTWVS